MAPGHDPVLTRRQSTLPKPWFSGSESKDSMRSFISVRLSLFRRRRLEQES